ncbi:ABC-2 type transport system permease protein [Flavobacterium fryxellicola]|uniref:ABC transporter permease n=1 Tax=Flavobacterium fryxellicola TaxID=249352 RepID=A0A167ZFV5_9FLAO|nr:ABC transporter permease [Flavobacterium fryxellicola]OAB30406.1 ABC transporter permease [Flavobacterium fryxellicola]SHN76332.1 ABC-2 type transport system permease protein [Flavobacterium fryxellicola]
MKTILFIVQKEFKQIFRDKNMLKLIFILPILQLLILSNAATFDVKNINITFVDNDQSSDSKNLIESFRASSYFKSTASFFSEKEAVEEMQKGNTDIIVNIPVHFNRDLQKQQKTSVSVTINAIDAATAGIENVYVTQIITTFNSKIQTESTYLSDLTEVQESLLVIPSFWYNKTLNYKTFMVPGILVLLVTMLTLFLSSMNIVKEKELGTLEQINVTPIKKHQFIIGKLFPFWILGLVILTVGLIIAKVVFNVPMLGNMLLVYLFTGVYLLLVLGIGLFISNHTDTQQQAMFIAWFFMVIFILMSGLFTPIESMPKWAQNSTLINPIRYFVEVMRMVMLKGSGFSDIIPQFVIISVYAILMNGLAVCSYKKTT